MGLLADAYGLIQVPIEVEGKEPNARELAQIIDFARRKESEPSSCRASQHQAG